jgi:hypothetical protein
MRLPHIMLLLTHKTQQMQHHPSLLPMMLLVGETTFDERDALTHQHRRHKKCNVSATMLVWKLLSSPHHYRKKHLQHRL